VLFKNVFRRRICSECRLQRGRRTERHHHHLPSSNCWHNTTEQSNWLLGLLRLHRQLLL